MAGHSHSANIARRKGAVDAKRSKQFSKLARAIIVAAKQGGGNPEANINLKYAIDRAKAVSLPRDKIERAIKRGTGELEGGQLDSCLYEAVGSGGTFFLIDALTDNRNRTGPEIKKILERRNAHIGKCGWAFESKGIIVIPSEGLVEDDIMEIVLDAGAEDIEQNGDYYEITTPPSELEAVRKAIMEKEIAIEDASLAQVPTSTVAVDEETGKKLLAFVDELDDHDDVQNVYTNIDFPASIMNG